MQLKSLCVVAVLAAGLQNSQADAQTVKPRSIMGVVTELRVQNHELVIATEDGNTVPVEVSMDTEFLRVPPGVRDLSESAPASPHASGVTSKPAIEGHFKTGQREHHFQD